MRTFELNKENKHGQKSGYLSMMNYIPGAENYLNSVNRKFSLDIDDLDYNDDHEMLEFYGSEIHTLCLFNEIEITPEDPEYKKTKGKAFMTEAKMFISSGSYYGINLDRSTEENCELTHEKRYWLETHKK